MTKTSDILSSQPASEPRTEEQELELQLKRLHVTELREQIAERELKRETIRMRARTNGATINQITREANAVQARCNHHKGGEGAHGVVGGQGTDQQYAVIKHTMANKDMWVICLRCGKHWKPPLRSTFDSEQAYISAYAEYKAACQFMTNNKPSSSTLFAWSDQGEFYREAVSHS